MAEYLHEIRSIRDVHPNLPARTGNIDLSQRIQANTPIDRVLLNQAEGVAMTLRGIKRRYHETSTLLFKLLSTIL